ncbi:MAG TPA: porin [Planctomycetaceae bacterium]|nr:porin [Planctomycetaceae bacterium]
MGLGWNWLRRASRTLWIVAAIIPFVALPVPAQSLESLTTATADNVPPSPEELSSADNVAATLFSDAPPDDDARIRRIVQEYMNELDAQRNAADASRAAKSSEGDPLDLKANWKNGLTLSNKKGDFKVHVGGRTQFDTAWFGVPQDIQNDPTIANRWGDGVDFRRLRLKVDGTMYDFIDWACQIDFVNSVRAGGVNEDVPAPTDLWWTFTKLPGIGNIRVGNQKEAIGFEHLVSSRFLPFMERSFNQDAFYGGFNNGFTPGISAFNTALDENMTWNVGIFKPTNNAFAFSTTTGDYAATGRITFLPWYEDEGRELVHLGFSARQASGYNDTYRLRTRAPIRSGISAVWPLIGDTGTFASDNHQQFNWELVGVRGPFTFQAEYLLNFTDSTVAANGTDIGNAMFHGGYAQVLYYLTGEHDEYSRKTAVFERVVPRRNARPNGRMVPLFCDGAWQVGARYDYLDLDYGAIRGGMLNDLTTGLNWFLNPNMKIQWNYTASHRNSGSGIGDGWVHGFGMRFAHDF